MKKQCWRIIFLSVILIFWNINSNPYKDELKEYKKTELDLVFNKDANFLLAGIQQDIQNYKKLSFFARLARFPLMALDVIVVTKKSMPRLYSYIKSLCDANNISIPAVFIVKNKNFFNAAASKLLNTSGGIAVGQELLTTCSEEEIEAIIAHEIGHIKHNHINKSIAIALASLIASSYIVRKCISYKSGWIHHLSINALNACFIALIIGKRHELQADDFACKEAKRPGGIIKFFQRLDEREAKADNHFTRIEALLSANKGKIECFDYSFLQFRYYCAKLGNEIAKKLKWFYHNTPFGPHPSNKVRIEKAQKYLL